MQRDVFNRIAVRRAPRVKPNSSLDVGRLNKTSPVGNGTSNEKVEKEVRFPKRNSDTALGLEPLTPADKNKIMQRNSDPHRNR